MKGRQLEESLEQLQLAQAEEEKRQWIQQGLISIHEILHSQGNGQQIKNRLMAEIVKTLKANQGAAYILRKEEERQYLSMEAVYAYGRKKFLHTTLEAGQGLPGQCLLEKEYIHLTEIPQDYYRITSGLGEALPQHLIFVPMMHNEETVEGMFEVASFRPFEAHHIQYLHQLGVQLASYFFNEQLNRQNEVLLQEFKQKTQELESQEEQMRQHMEEMQTTQEESDRKFRNYEKQLE